MPVDVRRRENETMGGMIRRFTRRVQQSGVLYRARKRQFWRPPKSKLQRREAALHREKVVKERQRLWKLGKLEEVEEQRR